MNYWRAYRKRGIQMMRPYVPGEDLSHVSVSPRDTPKEGDMIAVGDKPNDLWLVSAEFFHEKYEEVTL